MARTSEPDLETLEQRADFIRRHVGPDPSRIPEMLETLGLDSLDALADRAIPSHIRSETELALGESHTERATLERLAELAGKNQVFTSMIGMGYHGCFLPPVVRRNVLENPGFYTAYTAYQAEISQGRLEALIHFQTMVADLTGLPVANASLLDEATAAAEAMAMCRARAKTGRNTFWVSQGCHPQTIEVIRTRAWPVGIEVEVGDPERLDFDDERLFGILLQYPDTEGLVADRREVIAHAKANGVAVVVSADLLGLTLLTPPGELGADVVVGSTQRFGIPLGFGGPHAAYFATRTEYTRLVPGRMVGISVDASGRRAYRLALQTREQHIRRERATSNICTAQVLLAVLACMYAVYHGPGGLRTIAQRVHRLAGILAEGLRRLGFPPRHASFFDTLAVSVSDAAAILERARAKRINLRQLDAKTVGIALDETTTREDVARLWEVFAAEKAGGLTVAAIDAQVEERIPASLRRSSSYLTHPVFNSYHSETEMLRYLRRLEARDLSLTHSMIPLGSCTMKLNATVEMLPITWPGFSDIHPFAPLEQARGYLELIGELESMLAACTGFSAVSLQPNAGSQGELAGLLVIRKYHESRGEAHRDVCLIPSSAHGTNPASAVMAGMKVVVVRCDAAGNVDLDDLRQRALEHRDRLAALMITYPSTHGVFEESITKICDEVHRNGGQVYMDGANLNALVGYCKPGEFGPDVAHLNLHKTFCIPHGGGGPGVGPIGVAEHLAPFLPGHSLVPEAGPAGGVSALCAAPWGSAGILPISYAYIYLMGREGLRRATGVAILNANYLVARLSAHYKVLYRGTHGLVAHECIVDTRPLKAAAGVEVGDIARRLMDYGFHAPTISFPVPGTLMIEPTESESKKELDRFCDALIEIRREIREIEEGRVSREDNLLKNAPHTSEAIASDDWQHPYSRERAAFPLPWVRESKYWPPVGAIDNVYGDRNFVCTCSTPEEYARESARQPSTV